MRKPEMQMIENLIKQGELQDTSILCVCAGEAEAKLFDELGLKNITLTNIDENIVKSAYKYEKQDAMNLTYENESFDYVFVSNGLHHCSSPHAALLEMYRVTRRTIIIFEPKDSFLMRSAVRFGLTVEYEGVDEFPQRGWGGRDGSSVPNYIYRWTERELEKTICSYYPIGTHQFKYYYGLDVPKRINATLTLFIKMVLAIRPRSKNVFCATVTKPEVSGNVFPWIKEMGTLGQRGFQ